MKKILVASSALVAVAFAGSAQASEPISLSVGGYMEQWAGVASQEDGFATRNNFQSDTEVHFAGKTTLDNGIEVGAKIEFEGEAADGVDEQYLYVNGAFGQVKLGAEDGAAADMTITAPSVGPIGANDGGMEDWVGLNAVADNAWDDGDAKKITYYTPVLGGFRAGASFTADDTSEGDDDATSGNEVVSGGLEYSGEFDAVSVALAVTGEKKREGEWYHVGGTVGFGNFTVGASWGEQDAEWDLAENQTTTADDNMGYDFGVTYAMDAATVGLTYAYSENDDNNTASGADEIQALTLGLSYTLGAGVAWQTSAFWFDDEGQDAGEADDNDGYGLVTGLVLSF